MHVCRRHEGRRIKKSGENIILCCFSLSRDSKTHSQREAEVLLVTSVPCPLPWNAFGAPSIEGMGLLGSMWSSEGLWGGEWERGMPQVMAVSYCKAGLFLELWEKSASGSCMTTAVVSSGLQPTPPAFLLKPEVNFLQILCS